jgi:hypothetical protein
MREALATQRDGATEAALLEIPHPRSDFRPDIEGMRAVAILMVVAFHTGFGWIRGGFIGVDVFFVLSGYLITEILVKEIERTGRLSFSKFYARRAKRLLPASFLLVLCTLLLSFAILSPLEVTRIAQTALATGSYSSNLWFILKSTDYFGAGVDTNPLLHTWSLAVEEQFYLVWPLLLFLCLKQKKTRVATSHPVFFSSTACTIRETTAVAEPVWKAERLAAAGLDYVVPVDFTALFCRNGLCKPMMGNMVVYRDGNHITLALSHSFGPVIGDLLRSLSVSSFASTD